MDKLFNYKKNYIGNDGEELVNMCIPVVDVASITGNATIMLGPDDNGRLDRFVWRIVAKDMDMIDTVMYANHIFNPFAVQSEDVLNVPLMSDDIYVSSDEPRLPDGTKQSYNARNEKEMTYAEKVEYLARNGFGAK